MSDPDRLTAERALAAVKEAEMASLPVRTSDRLFAWRLVALAAAVVGMTLVLVLFGLLPTWAGPLEGLLAGVALTGAVWLVVSAQMRQHAYTCEGNRLFVGTLIVFCIWAQVVLQWSFQSGWWGSSVPHPTRALHFLLSALVAVIPLVLGALPFAWRR